MIISSENCKVEFFDQPEYVTNRLGEIKNILNLFVDFFDILKLDLEISFCSENLIRELNKKFRGKDSATNVLSFPSQLKSNNKLFLGDIIFSIETILEEAKRDNKTVENHLIHLFVHAVLHLLGYEHETEEQAKKMENLEIKILSNLQIDNPYS